MSLYDHVAVVAPGLSLQRREALAAAARSRGATTSVDDELRAAREWLAAPGEPVPSPTDARRRVAEAEADFEAMRETGRHASRAPPGGRRRRPRGGVPGRDPGALRGRDGTCRRAGGTGRRP